MEQKDELLKNISKQVLEQKEKGEKTEVTTDMNSEQSLFYRNFTNKSLDEQTDEITTDLVWQ